MRNYQLIPMRASRLISISLFNQLPKIKRLYKEQMLTKRQYKELVLRTILTQSHVVQHKTALQNSTKVTIFVV